MYQPGSLQKTFLLLAAHQMAKACECAQENDNHRLALALSMPPGAHVPRQMFFKQLSDWQNVQVTNIQLLNLVTVAFCWLPQLN